MTALPSRQGITSWQRRQEALLAGYPPSPSSARRVYCLLLNAWNETHGRQYDPHICAGCGDRIVSGEMSMAFNKASVHFGQRPRAQIGGLAMLIFYRDLSPEERSHLREVMPAFMAMAAKLDWTPKDDRSWMAGIEGLWITSEDYNRHLKPLDRLSLVADRFNDFDCLTAYGLTWRGAAQRGLEQAGVKAPYGWKP